VSEPITDDFRPIWRLRVSGKVGSGAGQILLIDDAGLVRAPLDGDFDATGSWRTLNFLRGSGPVRLLVRVPPGAELRVTEPLELGRLSWFAPKFLGFWFVILLAGAAAFVAGAINQLRHSAAS
jgi:hypothetical protein